MTVRSRSSLRKNHNRTLRLSISGESGIGVSSPRPYIPSVTSNTKFEVNILRYENLNHLVRESSSSRRYFLSLPVEMQIKLHEHNNNIHTSAELHCLVDDLKNYHRQVQISEYF